MATPTVPQNFRVTFFGSAFLTPTQADEMNPQNNSPPKNVLPDLIIPALALAFTVYYLTTITEVPWIAQASAITVSALLLLSVVAFAIRTVFRINKGREFISWQRLNVDTVYTVRRAILLALTIAYVYFLDTLGFTLATTVFIFCGIVLLSSLANWRKAALVALSCSIAGYVVFIHFFQTRFPKGIIENFLKGLQ